MLKRKSNRIPLNSGTKILFKDWESLVPIFLAGVSAIVVALVIYLTAMTYRVSYLYGLLLMVSIFFLISGIFARLFHRNSFGDNKHIFLSLLLIVLMASAARFIIISPLSNYLIPVSSVAMLAEILIGTAPALMVTVILSLLIGLAAGGQFGLVVVGIVGGVVGIYAVRKARRRSQILRAGICVSSLNVGCLLGLGLIMGKERFAMLGDLFWGMSNGLLSSFLVMGLLPIFEYLFKLTTNISLLELSDLNHPLLRELSAKAPGTYHHSLVVGNLAEAACEAIGANSLLARVGAYFHDVGKMGKSEYFAENQTAKKSKHDKLSPTMSSLVITNHIKDGVELAKKYKLNPSIIDFIEQHHGTGLIFFFYQRAKEREREEEKIPEQEFRYPGPRPQIKETAIVMLADSVEAASRSLSEPTPARIGGLVKKIINNKFVNGQLDECDLTLRDFNKIASSFEHILTGIYHTRVGYPED